MKQTGLAELRFCQKVGASCGPSSGGLLDPETESETVNFRDRAEAIEPKAEWGVTMTMSGE